MKTARASLYPPDGPRKTVRVLHSSTLGIHPDDTTAWEDIWLEFKGKPGRKKRIVAGMIISRSNLELDLQVNDDCAQRYPEHREAYEEDNKRLQEIWDQLQAVQHVIINTAEKGQRDHWVCYTAEYAIDRSEADRMLQSIMSNCTIYEWCRFQWQKERDYTRSL